MYEDLPSCTACGGDTYFLGTLGKMMHYRCRACGLDGCTEDEEEVSDDPFGGDDSRADAELLGERDGYDEREYDDDPCNFIGEEP